MSRQRGPAARVAAAACLLAPFAALLWVPWYAAAGPRLAGMPFFYWYQLAWIPGSAVLMAVAYRLTRHERPEAHPSPDTPDSHPGGRA
jgi:uncharacterized membrane protein